MLLGACSAPPPHQASNALPVLPEVDRDTAQRLLGAGETLQTLSFAVDGSTSVDGTIEANRSTAYAVAAAAGQEVQVVFMPSDTGAIMNIWNTGEESGVPVHVGLVNGNRGELFNDAATTYVIRPSLTGAAASDARATYTITVSRSGD